MKSFVKAHSVELILFAFTFLSYAFYYGGATWAANARLDAIFAYVEPGTSDYRSFSIDRFMVDPELNYNTGDYSFARGHYYANKAPGGILYGILVYSALFHAERLLGFELTDPFIQIFNAYAVNLVIQVLMLALAMPVFYWLLLGQQVPRTRAALITLALSFGTLLFPFSTVMWGHATAVAWIVFALHFLGKDRPKALFFSGLFIGLAVLTDYLAAIVLLAMGCWVLSRHRTATVYFILGGLAPLLLFAYYHYVCFGAPFVFATDFTNPSYMRDAHMRGLFGPIYGEAVWGLTFGPRRGIFFFMPILLLSLVGAYRWLRRAPRDPFLWMMLASMLGLFLINASFHAWTGGDSAAARYQMIVLPFWVMLLKEIPWSRLWRGAYFMLFGISMLNMLALATVSTMLQEDWENPLFEFIYPHFLASSFPPHYFPIRLHLRHPDWAEIAPYSNWNIGGLLGMDGLWGLFPLFVVAAICIGLLRHELTEQRED